MRLCLERKQKHLLEVKCRRVPRRVWNAHLGGRGLQGRSPRFHFRAESLRAVLRRALEMLGTQKMSQQWHGKPQGLSLRRVTLVDGNLSPLRGSAVVAMAGKADRSTGPVMEGRECLGRLSFIYPFTPSVRSGHVLSDDQVGGDRTVQGTMGPYWIHQGRLPGGGWEEEIPWVHAGYTREGFPEEAGRRRSQCELEMSGEVRLRRN